MFGKINHEQINLVKLIINKVYMAKQNNEYIFYGKNNYAKISSN